MANTKNSRLKKKLWKLVSEYVRRRDFGVCFTCGAKKHWRQMQAGHFIPKKICGADLYFDERNIHCQCFRCNINLGGNGAIYAQNMRKRYGDEFVNEIYRMFYQKITQWKEIDLDKLYQDYDTLLKNMHQM